MKMNTDILSSFSKFTFFLFNFKLYALYALIIIIFIFFLLESQYHFDLLRITKINLSYSIRIYSLLTD